MTKYTIKKWLKRPKLGEEPIIWGEFTDISDAFSFIFYEPKFKHYTIDIQEGCPGIDLLNIGGHWLSSCWD